MYVIVYRRVEKLRGTVHITVRLTVSVLNEEGNTEVWLFLPGLSPCWCRSVGFFLCTGFTFGFLQGFPGLPPSDSVYLCVFFWVFTICSPLPVLWFQSMWPLMPVIVKVVTVSFPCISPLAPCHPPFSSARPASLSISDVFLLTHTHTVYVHIHAQKPLTIFCLLLYPAFTPRAVSKSRCSSERWVWFPLCGKGTAVMRLNVREGGAAGGERTSSEIQN